MTALLALLLKIAGTSFLLVATLGVLRFHDPFQRMHAATKAGTLGAGLVLAGAAVTKGSVDATLVAVLTILFLIATMPVAGHLLGRAAYISGAPLRSRGDALAGVLPRMAAPLEARLRGAGQAEDASASSFEASQPARAPERSAPTAPDGDASASAFAEPLSAPAPGNPAPAAAGEAGATAEGSTHGVMGRALPLSESLLRLITGRTVSDEDANDDGGDVKPGFAGIRFPVIGATDCPVAARAWQLAVERGVPATAIAVIDTSCLETARVANASDSVKACLATAIADTREAMRDGEAPFTMIYEEGDPLTLIPCPDAGQRELLLLPTDGWFHHGAHITIPVFEDRLADKLFTLAELHAGPTLFVGTATPAERRCAIIHDGTRRTQRLAVWALRTGVWSLDAVTLVGRPSDVQRDALMRVADEVGLELEHQTKPMAPFTAFMPYQHARITGVIMGMPPQPARISAYGTFWQDRIIPGFRGDVLVA
jgi:monovalent cation/proton antiporter MnhG/PhaG subunit